MEHWRETVDIEELVVEKKRTRFGCVSGLYCMVDWCMYGSVWTTL